MKCIIYCVAVLTFSFSLSVAEAQNTVVVVPIGGAVGDAVPSDVVEGKTFSSKAGKGLIGTLELPLQPEGEVPVVTSAGQIWMALNLGASQVATSSVDPAAYGTLYQWGRFNDGHEYRSSPTTTAPSNTDVPGHGSFILATSNPFDWRTPQHGNLWQGESGINNPCPAGFRLPTETEWEREKASWTTDGSAGAYDSPLKLVLAGYRNCASGSVSLTGTGGGYWSSTVTDTASRYLEFRAGFDSIASNYRAYGFSVRCLQD